MPGNRLVPEQYAGTIFRFDHYPRRPDRHRHVEWELNLVTRGSSHLIIGDKRYTIYPHDAVWLFPDQVHTLYEESEDFSMWVALFTPESLKTWCRSETTKGLRQRDAGLPYVRALAPETAGRLFRWCENLLKQHSDADYFNASLHHFMLEAWGGFKRAATKKGGEGFHPAVSRMLELLATGHGTESVQSLCQRAGLSRSSLSQRFKEEVGVDITTFRNRVKLDRCMALYGDGHSHNLLQCAYEAGFGSYTQFYRVFRSHFKTGPREFTAKRARTG